MMFVLNINFNILAAGQDPTRPLMIEEKFKKTDKKSTKKVMQPLTAIFVASKSSSAIIEGKIYHIGEYYKDGKIINIYHDKIVLQSSAGNYDLTLIPNIKK